MNADIASETSELARRQILQRASISVLASANQQPQLARTLRATPRLLKAVHVQLIPLIIIG